MEHQLLLEKYHSSVISFLEEASRISGEALNKSHDGEWSAAFVIHHIADAEIQFGARYAKALTDENPPIVPFNEEQFAIGLQYNKRSVENSLKSLAATFALNYEILKNASDADWKRTSQHPQIGVVTLFDLLQKSANHIESHIVQLKSAAN
jgi:hypothetical protein